MANSIAGILITLHKIATKNPNDKFDSQTEEELDDLLSLIEELDCWVEKQSHKSFLKVSASHPQCDRFLTDYSNCSLPKIQRKH
jgi:hypothetical protein